jgi:hypothetical protein
MPWNLMGLTSAVGEGYLHAPAGLSQGKEPREPIV